MSSDAVSFKILSFNRYTVVNVFKAVQSIYGIHPLQLPATHSSSAEVADLADESVR
jgi:hypothetical protein